MPPHLVGLFIFLIMRLCSYASRVVSQITESQRIRSISIADCLGSLIIICTKILSSTKLRYFLLQQPETEVYSYPAPRSRRNSIQHDFTLRYKSKDSGLFTWAKVLRASSGACNGVTAGFATMNTPLMCRWSVVGWYCLGGYTKYKI